MVGKPDVIRFIRHAARAAATLPLFARRFQLPIPLGMNLVPMPSEHVARRDASDGAVQANVVVRLGMCCQVGMSFQLRSWTWELLGRAFSFHANRGLWIPKRR
jgi:hypothetical protein